MNDPSTHLTERVATLEAQVAYLFEQLSLAPGGDPSRAAPGLDPEIARLARSGNKIAAIKRHRELYGSDLAAAKQIVDGLA